MRKMLSLILILTICALASPPAIAGEPEEKAMWYQNTWIYGDYAFTVENGQATIVYTNYGDGPSWDDEEEREGLSDRPGKEDESAAFPHFVDGVRRMTVPATLCGYPVVAVDDYAFGQSAWGDIVLPEGLSSIGRRAFCMCYGANAITVPASVTFIGEEAFTDECAAMLRVTEGSYAAQYAEENDIPYTYDMEYKVFRSGDWEYTLTGGAATIYRYNGEPDYDDDWNVIPVDLVIPDHLDGHPVTAIKHLVAPFEELHEPYKLAHLTSATIPAGVMEIQGNPFAGSTGSSFGGSIFVRIGVAPDNPVYEDIDGVLFNKQQKTLVTYPSARAGDYAIPDGVTGIGDNAFDGCKGLIGVTIPEGVMSIGDEAFYECEGLTSATIPEGVTSIGDYAFYRCSGLTSMTIPASVKSIGEGAFSLCEGLTSITILEGVTSIGDEAFYRCSGLTSITIPASVTSIEANPFSGCLLQYIEASSNNLVYEAVDGVLFNKQQKVLVAFPGGRAGDYAIPDGMVAIGDGAFYECKGLAVITIPEGVTHIGVGAFNSSGLTGVIIPDSVTAIGDGAFARCTSLTSAILPEGVTHIGDAVFSWCEDLTSVTIPASVTSIGDHAFSGCKRLTSVTIPESVAHIGYYAFGSSGLTSITIPGSVTRIGDDAFHGCERLTSVIIQEGVTHIGNQAFGWCDNLTSVTIPEGVTSIGHSVFYECNRLASVTIPASVTSIGSHTFYRHFRKPIPLSVTEGSYAEQYAKENDIDYVHIEQECLWRLC